MFVTAGCAACVMASCGGSPESHGAGEAQQAARARETPPRPAPAGVVAASDDATDTTSISPVSPTALQAAMPQIAGWQRAAPTGDRVMSPFNFAQASVSYAKDDARVVLKIMDSALNQRLFAPFDAQMTAGYTKTTLDGFERAVTLRGSPGWETWDSGSRNGELGVVVARRYLVQIEGHGVADVRTLHDVLDRVDFTALASLR
jgi:hypothetical protein